MRRDLILGPPGTGKTYTLMRELERLREEGFSLDAIAFVSFTRRAMAEARDRARKTFDLGQDPPWFRTLHSAFWHRLGLGEGVKIKPEDWKAFGESCHYDITGDGGGDFLEEGFAAPKTGRPDDELMAALDWSRCRLTTVEDAAAASGLHLARLRAFAKKYGDWKRANGKMDFTDVLEEAVRRGVKLPVDVLIVDEAQDLNPLQIKAIGPTLQAAEQVIIAGDDDQAIFTFAGAEPDWIMWLAADTAGWSTRVLEQSYRVPASVHRLAQKLIGGNKRRVAKVYRPRDEAGEVVFGEESLAACVAQYIGKHGGTAAILGRTRKALTEHIAELFAARAVPYLVTKGAGANPLGAEKQIKAIGTAFAVADGQDVTRTDLEDMIGYVQSLPRNTFIPWGVKEKVKRWPAWIITAEDIDELGLGPLRERARRHGHVTVLNRIDPAVRAWHDAMWSRYGRVPEPVCIVSTIHGVKGAEFDLVCIDPSHPNPVEQAMQSRAGREDEARVAYVAVTRAKKRLVIGRQRGKFGYRYG